MKNQVSYTHTVFIVLYCYCTGHGKYIIASTDKNMSHPEKTAPFLFFNNGNRNTQILITMSTYKTY